MNLEKLKKSYKPNISKFRRNWINLFRSYSTKNKLQPSVFIVLTSFILTVIMTFNNLGNFAYMPFLIGCSFVLISFVYFHFFPLSWKEMNDEEKEVYRLLHKLPKDWELE